MVDRSISPLAGFVGKSARVDEESMRHENDSYLC